MTEALSRCAGVVVHLVQVSFGYHAERAHSRERPALVAADLVDAVADQDVLATAAERQVEIAGEDIIGVAVANVLRVSGAPAALAAIPTVAAVPRVV